MRIAIVADTFPPLCNSGAVQLRDLSMEFAQQGHAVTVIMPTTGLQKSWKVESMGSVQILRLKAPRVKDIGYFRRALAEFLMPFVMLFRYRKSPLYTEKWEGLVWYSPSIFHGPFVSIIKSKSTCNSYLILRDIFPQWAVEMGLMRPGLIFKLFDAIARYQYFVADKIGVQSQGDYAYFNQLKRYPRGKLEILSNWLGPLGRLCSNIRLNQTKLAGRKIFVYAGNMGVAQGMDILFKIVSRLRTRDDLGFLFVGRGSGFIELKEVSKKENLENILFYDEISPDEIPDLFSQCHAGIVALDYRLKSHNIPGKFLNYLQCGLPVLANVNPGNDLIKIIKNEEVGQVSDSNNIEELIDLTLKLLEQIESDPSIKLRCRKLFERNFSVEKAAHQIITSLSR